MNKKKSIDAMKDLQVLEKENLIAITGGGTPAGWTRTVLPNGDIRYDGPNGSFFIIHASETD